MSDLDIDIQREVLRDLGRAFDPAAYGPRAKAGRIAVLAAAVAIAAASGGTLGAGERTERAALWLSAATDVAATKYGQVACERDPYCHSATERGWLGRLVVGDSATGWQPLLVKAGTTLMIDLASRELGRDGDKLEARADARAVTACSVEDWEAVQRLRRSARSSRAWSKRLRVGGAILWAGAAGWALYQAH